MVKASHPSKITAVVPATMSGVRGLLAKLTMMMGKVRYHIAQLVYSRH